MDDWISKYICQEKDIINKCPNILAPEKSMNILTNWDICPNILKYIWISEYSSLTGLSNWIKLVEWLRKKKKEDETGWKGILKQGIKVDEIYSEREWKWMKVDKSRWMWLKLENGWYKWIKLDEIG